ncbi:hypothetical protein SA21304_2557 [Staphylococcus aureus subsp. aureus 21304]|nr:hypothetical protein SA21304_2557 [Staphylococcus aureus subsp. aureus 21304]
MSVLETKLKSQMSKSAKIARNMNKLPDEIDRLRKRIERINKKENLLPVILEIWKNLISN